MIEVKLINLTAHDIVIIRDDGDVKQDEVRKTFSADPSKVRIKLTIPFSINEKTKMPRAVEENSIVRCVVTNVNGNGHTLVRIAAPKMRLEHLPPYEEGVFLITSQWVATLANAQGRWDVVAPSKIVRTENDSRVILGCLELGTSEANPILAPREFTYSNCDSCGAYGGQPLGEAYYGTNVEEQVEHDSGVCPICQGWFYQ
jgi:hypothetical protein